MSIQFNNLSNQINSNDIFTFGKYYKCKVEDILEEDPGYIAHLMANTNMKFSEYIREEAIRKSRPRYKNYWDESGTDQYWDDVPF